jgi:transcriptional regulator with XRE-family HTH domain
MLTPAQTRAARGWLGWTQQELAAKAGVGLSTLRAFEAGQREPIRNNLGALRHAIESAGVRLLFDGEKATGIATDDARPSQITVATAASEP